MFYYDAQKLLGVKKERDRTERARDIGVTRQKREESEELTKRREEERQRWRQKHL